MRRFLPFLLLLALTPTLMAQVGLPRRDLAVGLSGGYALNKVSFNPTIKQKFHGGITFGTTIRYTCEKYFSALCALQGEINYIQLGWKELIETSPNTYQRNINYVQIPLLANVGFGRERGGARFFIAIGPQIGYMLSENEKRGGGEWDGVRPNNVVEQYDLSVQQRFEYGLTGGLGLDLSTRSGHHFLIEGRYYFALSDIFHNSKKDFFGRSANGAIIAKASYLFDVVRTKQ